MTAAIRAVDRRLAQFAVHESGRACRSVFRLIEYDGVKDASLVLCQPVTGRTHQLRVHLQHIGHPIVNDARYGGETQAEHSSSPAERETGDEQEDEDEAETAARDAGGDGDTAQTVEEKEEEPETAAARLARIQRDSFDPSCPQCKDSAVFSFRRLQEDEKAAAMPLPSLDSAAIAGVGVDMICLHAWRYDIDGSSYEVDWPAWAGGSEGRARWVQAEAQRL